MDLACGSDKRVKGESMMYVCMYVKQPLRALNLNMMTGHFERVFSI